MADGRGPRLAWAGSANNDWRGQAGAGRDRRGQAGTSGTSGAPSAVHTKPHALNPKTSINSLIHSSETLPVNLPNSSSISSLPLDLGMLPTKSRRFGTLILILRVFPGFIS